MLRWTRRSITSGRRRHSQRTPSSKHPLATGPIKNLPVELLYAILEYVEGPEYLHTLRALSCSSRFLNNLLTPILWRGFNMSDEYEHNESQPLASAKRWRHRLHEMSLALTTNRHRASCVHSLTIVLSGSQLGWSLYRTDVVKDVRDALLALPSLRRLKLYIMYRDPPLIIHRLAPMMEQSTFPFQLTEFECPSSLEAAILPFIWSQRGLERYTVKMDPGYMWYEGRKLQAQRAHAYQKLSTSLVAYCGPPAYARAMCLVRHLNTIEIPSKHADYDLQQLQSDIPLIQSNFVAAIPNVTLVFNEQRHVPHNIGDRLIELLSVGYNISVNSIKHLKADFLSGWYESPPFTGFRPSILEGFQNLESIKWGWSISRAPHNMEREDVGWNGWTKNFVRDCEKHCPTLRRISLMNGERRTAEFVRVQARDDENEMISQALPPVTNYYDGIPTSHNAACDSPNTDGNPVHALLTLASGSIWTVQTDFPYGLAYMLYCDVQNP